MRKTIVVFDLWETLFTDEHYDFEAGLKYLYDGFLSARCTFEEFKTEFYRIFQSLFRMGESGPTEVCLIRDVIPPLFLKYGVEMPEDDAKLEYMILTSMQEYSVSQDVRDLLERLSSAGVKLAILSNGLFRGSLVERLLSESGIRRYFERVFSSADYGVKKPGKGFFEIALKQIREDANRGRTACCSMPESRKSGIIELECMHHRIMQLAETADILFEEYQLVTKDIILDVQEQEVITRDNAVILTR